MHHVNRSNVMVIKYSQVNTWNEHVTYPSELNKSILLVGPAKPITWCLLAQMNHNHILAARLVGMLSCVCFTNVLEGLKSIWTVYNKNIELRWGAHIQLTERENQGSVTVNPSLSKSRTWTHLPCLPTWKIFIPFPPKNPNKLSPPQYPIYTFRSGRIWSR